MGKAKVLIFGDLNLDIVFEAPKLPSLGEFVKAETMRLLSGGVGGNIAHNLALLGLEPYIIGAVGTDIFGDMIISDLEKVGVKTDFIRRHPGSSGIMSIFVYGGERTMVGHRGANEYNIVTDEILEKIPEFDYVHVSGYTFLNVDNGSSTLKILEEARKHGIPSSIDLEGVASLSKEKIKELKRKVDYIMLNDFEAQTLIRATHVELDKLRDLAIGVLGAKHVYLKMGYKGSMVITPDKTVFKQAHKIVPKDTTGAGDAFDAGVIYGVVNKLSLEETLLLANSLGAYACLFIGARPPVSKLNLVAKFPELKEIFKL